MVGLGEEIARATAIALVVIVVPCVLFGVGLAYLVPWVLHHISISLT